MLAVVLVGTCMCPGAGAKPACCSSTTWWSRWPWCLRPPSGSPPEATASRSKTSTRDELGELVDNINDMSLKIGQNEKMKTEFISSVSHELRTPLTAINGWGETLLEDTGSDPEPDRTGACRIILNESRRLSTMVEELLEFSKMEDGRFTLRRGGDGPAGGV
ncbi:MAG: histidine kinase dimerization/phospho-acceptor domain-containing protein [Dysosmobacter sp.]